MIVQNQIPDIAADGVVGIGEGTGAPALPPGAYQTVNRTTLTCTWVIADDGALAMQWTAQTPEDGHEEIIEAAA